MSPRLLPLEEAPARQVLGLLQAEAEEWRRRLHWQRDDIAQLAGQLALRRRLPGWALLDRGEAVAKVLLGGGGSGLSLELPYVAAAARGRGWLEELLSGALVEARRLRPGARLEVAFFAFDEEEPRALERLGARLLRRAYMVRPAAAGPPPPVGAGPRELRLAPWPGPRRALAEVLHAAYADAADREAAQVYARLTGCRRYLRALSRAEECGRFLPDASAVARLPDGTLAGFVLATQVGPDTAHVAQIAVAPGRQGDGIGRSLLAHLLGAARAAGLARCTLLVSEPNERAWNWYRRWGFQPVERFLAYWQEGDGVS